MNPLYYLDIFAFLALIALSLQIWISYWLPICIGGGVVILLTILLRR